MSMPGKDDVVELLGRYSVRSHYRMSRRAGTVLYAVFGPEGQVTDATTHGEARQQCDLLTASDIVELFTGEAG